MEVYIDEYTPTPVQFKWKISEEELRTLSQTRDSLISRKNDVEGIPDLQFGLKASVVEGDEEEKNTLEMSLALLGLTYNDITVHGKFAFCIKSADCVTKYDNAFNAHDEDDFNWDKDEWKREICSVDDLFNVQKRFIVNDSLTVEMKGLLYTGSYVFFNTKSDDDENDSDESDDDDYFEPAQETLGDCLFKGDDKDFIIVVGKKEDKEKAEIKVHKCVLASRSIVFKKMLQTNMKEKAESKVEITDFDAKVVQDAVEFCYDQDLNNENGIDLLRFADKYDIRKLKDELEVNLIDRDISPETVCEIANAAIISNAPKLRDFCFRALLIFMRQAVPVENFDILDKEFSDDLFKKAFSGKYY